MAGTRSGGLKTAAKNREKYGTNFYSIIGARGGSNSVGGGFASKTKGSDGLTGSQRARIAGEKGGRASKRRKVQG